MPTLLQINVTANWGSTGKIAEQIGLCAQAHGWKSYIAFGRMANPSKNELVKIGNAFDVYEHYTEARLLDNEGLASRRATKRLLRRMDEIKPDIVHFHNIHDHYLNYPMLFRYLAEKKIPVVWTQHDQWATTGHCCYNLVGCERWKEECHDCPISEWYSIDRSRRNFRLKKQLMEDIPSLTIVPVSEWLADMMRQSHFKYRSIEVIHNGVDLDVFKPVHANCLDKYSLQNEKYVIAVASTWTAAKGLNDFIKIRKTLSDEIKIVLVGLSMHQIESLPKGIIGIPCTQNQLELVQLYSGAQALVSLSRSETFGLTIAEALACGTPAIVYDNTAQPDLIDNNTGCVIPDGDFEKVSLVITEFILTDFKTKHTTDCNSRAMDLFDKNKSFLSYIQLYNKLLGGGKTILIGVAAPWSERKGLKDYIELSKELDNRFVIVLVGLTDAQIEKLPDNIIGIRRTQNQTELAYLYSMADILLSLSYGETFGMTMAEAYACGTPCIVYDNTAQPEIVTPQTGRVAKTGNVEEMVKLIYDMMENRFKHKHTVDCRKRAEQCFDKDKCFEKYIELYNQILSKHEHKG